MYRCNIIIEAEEEFFKQRTIELGWDETVRSLVAEAYTDPNTGELVPAVYEDIPNPVTWQQYYDDYVDKVLKREFTKKQKEVIKKAKQQEVEQEFIAIEQLVEQIFSVEITEF